METFFIKAFQLILALTILVIIHEFGHFLFARLFGVKVEKFYIFFNPWFSLFKWKPKNKKNKKGFWNDTEYGIGWLPLGGYCKIAGMIDESMDTEQMKQPAQDWEFRSKPAWQRLLIMIAGVLFNFLTAILIYAGIVYATGEKYVPFDKADMGMAFSKEAQKAGFRDGDIPLSADGKLLESPAEGRMRMIEAKEVKVLRGDDTISITLPNDFMLRLNDEAMKGESNIAFMTYRIPARVNQVVTGEGADKGGVIKGDRIIAVDGRKTESLDEFFDVISTKKHEKVNVTVARPVNNSVDTLNLAVQLNDGGKMGIGLDVDPSLFFDSKEIHYSIFESVPRGIEKGTDQLTSYAKSMKMVFTKEGAKSVGGFGSIGSIFPEKWNWIAFWNIAAFLSVALAFMNILPIPALDGGHVLFLLYEVITRRKPSEKFMEYAQMTGMILLILLLIYANGMDIVRLFK